MDNKHKTCSKDPNNNPPPQTFQSWRRTWPGEKITKSFAGGDVGRASSSWRSCALGLFSLIWVSLVDLVVKGWVLHLWERQITSKCFPQNPKRTIRNIKLKNIWGWGWEASSCWEGWALRLSSLFLGVVHSSSSRKLGCLAVGGAWGGLFKLIGVWVSLSGSWSLVLLRG